jgi:hypothetical protein
VASKLWSSAEIRKRGLESSQSLQKGDGSVKANFGKRLTKITNKWRMQKLLKFHKLEKLLRIDYYSPGMLDLHEVRTSR